MASKIAGRVLNYLITDKEVGVPDASVFVIKDDRRVRTEQTDQDGKYTSDDLEEGTYSLRQFKVGWMPVCLVRVCLRDDEEVLAGSLFMFQENEYLTV